MANTSYKRDLEDSDESLDYSERDPVGFWETKQRELVTSVVDYNLQTLTSLIEDNDIDLSPNYQRRFRWDQVRQSKLIESFLMNVPVPPVFLNEDQYGRYSVIDGKQRLSAIYEFLRGRLVLKGLEVFRDINGNSLDTLPRKLQTVLRTRPTLRAVIILRQSDQDVKFEVFKRLNTGGVHLNLQEIRNSTHPGPLNDVILDLSIEKKFHKLLGIKNKEKSAIYQEMRDAEFVLRFFTFRNKWESFSGGIQHHLDTFMAENQHMPDELLQELKQDFLQTLDSVEACFGEYAFRRWNPERKHWRQQVLASLYEAEMLACRGISPDLAFPKQQIIVEEFKGLFESSEFKKAVDSSVASYFRERVIMIRNLINRVLD